MKTKIILLFSLSLLATKISTSQNVSYKVTEDDPYAIKSLGIHLDPFWMDMWGTNLITMGFGARADYHLGRLGSAHFDFRRAYLDITEMGLRDRITSNSGWVPARGKFVKFTYIEPHIALNIVDKTKDVYLNVTLSSSSYTSGGYTYTNSKYITVPGTMRKIIALHGSFYTLNSCYDFKSDSGLIATTTIAGKDTSMRLNSDGYGNMTTAVLAAGFSFKKIKNLWISTDNYGTRGHTGYSDFTIDFLFAPVIKLSDMKNLSSGIPNEEWKIDTDAKKRIGWRAYWSIKKPTRSAISYKFEFGSRPGLKPGWFFNMIMGFNIAAM